MVKSTIKGQDQVPINRKQIQKACALMVVLYLLTLETNGLQRNSSELFVQNIFIVFFAEMTYTVQKISRV